MTPAPTARPAEKGSTAATGRGHQKQEAATSTSNTGTGPANEEGGLIVRLL